MPKKITKVAETSKFKKYGIPLGLAGTVAGLLIYLSLLGATITSDGDKMCQGTFKNPCISYFNVSGLKDSYTVSMNIPEVRFSKAVRNSNLEWLNNGTWKKVNWKGFTFYSNVTTQFKLTGYKGSPGDTVKWSFGFDKGYLDPIWSSDISSNITVLDLNYGHVANVSMTWLNASSTCLLYNTTSGIYGQHWFEHNISAGGTVANTTFTNFANNETEQVSWITSVPPAYGAYYVRAWANDSCGTYNSSSQLIITSANTMPTVSLPSGYSWITFPQCNRTGNQTTDYVQPSGQNSTVGIMYVNNTHTNSTALLVYVYQGGLPGTNLTYWCGPYGNLTSTTNITTSAQNIVNVSASSSAYIYCLLNCTEQTEVNMTVLNSTLSWSYGIADGEQ